MVKVYDLTGQAFGSNKLRRLEYLMADSLVIEGANVTIVSIMIASVTLMATTTGSRGSTIGALWGTIVVIATS